MGKRSDKTNTGEGGKGKKSRTVSDDSGGKSLSDTSTSAGEKSTAIRTSVNIFQTSVIFQWSLKVFTCNLLREK